MSESSLVLTVSSLRGARAVHVISETLQYPELAGALVEQQPFDWWHLQCVLSLSLDTWWSRTWVLQEVILAKKISFHYEARALTFEQLETFLDKLVRHKIHSHKDGSWGRLQETGLRDLRRKISTIRERREDFGIVSIPEEVYSPWLALSEVFFEVRTRQVTDPKDRIYGLLALVSKAFGTTLIKPDYRVSLRDTLIDFTRQFMIKSRSLILLSQTAQPTNSVHSLPSWVPDFSSRYDFYAERQRVLHQPAFDASYSLQPEVLGSISFSNDCVQLKGLFVDKVAFVGAINDNTPYDDGAWHVQALSQWEKQCLSIFPDALSMRYPLENNYTVWAAFCRTLTIGMVEFGTDPSFEIFHSLVAEFEAHGNSTDGGLCLGTYARRMRRAISKRRFFVTEKGYLGIGSIDALVGDSVIILAGGNVPFILRQSTASPTVQEALTRQSSSTTSGNVFVFVGNCYMQGIMYGEFVQQALEPKFQDLWLV